MASTAGLLSKTLVKRSTLTAGLVAVIMDAPFRQQVFETGPVLASEPVHRPGKVIFYVASIEVSRQKAGEMKKAFHWGLEHEELS
jgi:hypothetical protein